MPCPSSNRRVVPNSEVASHAELTSKSGRPRCLPLGAVLPAWCDQIPTPAKNQLYPYSGHSCAHRHPHDFGKLFIGDVNHRKPELL